MISMNIVMTTDYFPPHVGGGVEVVTYRIASELVRLGHDVSVVTLNTRKTRRFQDLNGIRTYRANAILLTRRLGVESAFSFEAIKLVDDVCRKERADILHANSLHFFTTVAACAISRLRHQPLVTTLHVADTSNLESGRMLAKAYDMSIGRLILEASRHVVAVSNAVMKYAMELGVNPLRLSVIPNAVDLNEFSPKGNTRNIVRVGFVGRLISNKGPQYYLEAAAQVLKLHPETEFSLIGDGPMRKQLEERVAELQLTNCFQFLGNVPSVSDFLNECDVFVRPSLTEGMPLTVLEAMACGVPVIASRVGGTPELITDGENGFLIDPKSVSQLRDCLLRLIKDEKLRRRVGSKGRAYVEEHHSWREVAARMSTLYEQIAESY